MHVLLTLAFVILIAIIETAPSTAQNSGIHPVVIIILLVDYLIPIELSNAQEVACLVLPAAWWLSLWLVIIVIVPREMLFGA
jgi:hypothetical protein